MGTVFGLIVVLIISIAFNIYLYSKLKNIKKEEQIEKNEREGGRENETQSTFEAVP